MCVHTHVCVYVCTHINMHVGTEVASGDVGGFFRGVREAEIVYTGIRVWVGVSRCERRERQSIWECMYGGE